MQNTLIKLFYDSVKKVPNKDAIIHGKRTVNYEQLWKQSCSIANYLIKNKLKTGDRVAILLENSPEYAAVYYGILLAGGAVVGLNSDAKSRDIANWIIHSESIFIFANSRHRELEKIKELIPCDVVTIIEIGDINDDSGLWRNIKPNMGVDFSMPDVLSHKFDASRQLASIIYTSGTTGRPKGVMLSHFNLYSNMKSILSYLKLTESDSIVNILPFYYSYGNSILHTHLAVGGTLILANSMLYPQQILSLMEEKRVSGFSGVPSTYNILLSRTRINSFDLSPLRYMTQAGGAMAPSSIERVMQVLPKVKFYVMYGQTEASARLSYLPPESLIDKNGSIGIPIYGVSLAVKDENKSIAKPGETGEIYAYGDNIMLGYWKDPEQTLSVLHEGWLKTGDLGYKDEDGYLYLVGRSSDMIKSGAHRISPKDIEEVILELDEVEEVAVIAVPDEILGQAIKAVIVMCPGCVPDKKDIMKHCKANLAIYKMPKQIEFADELPKTASGKVRRFMLEESLGDNV